MIPLLLSELAQVLNGKLVGEDITITQLVTDSRALKCDEAFLALKGANFDGHRFLTQVIEAGCNAVVVDHECQLSVPQIVVTDTHKALGEIGAYVKAKSHLKPLLLLVAAVKPQ